MKYRLELHIYDGLDVQLIHEKWLVPIDKALGKTGSAYQIMPSYTFNAIGKDILKTIRLEDKVLHLQCYTMSITLHDLLLGIEILKDELNKLGLLNCSVLQFENNKYNLLQVFPI